MTPQVHILFLGLSLLTYDARSPTSQSESELKTVNIIGPTDDRGALSTFHREISFSEQAKIRQSVGIVSCKASWGTFEATGLLVQNGRQILMNAHTIADEELNVTRPFPFCKFAANATPSNAIDLPIAESRSVIVGTTRPLIESAKDYAVVYLREPVNSISMDIGAPPVDEEPVFLVTSFAVGSKNEIGKGELVVRECKVRSSYGARFISDCDASISDSGGPYYARRNGKLEVVGIHQGSGKKAADFKPFLERSDDQNSLSFSSGINLAGEIRQAIDQLAMNFDLKK